jgi:hypothetical protein
MLLPSWLKGATMTKLWVVTCNEDGHVLGIFDNQKATIDCEEYWTEYHELTTTEIDTSETMSEFVGIKTEHDIAAITRYYELKDALKEETYKIRGEYLAAKHKYQNSMISFVEKYIVKGGADFGDFLSEQFTALESLHVKNSGANYVDTEMVLEWIIRSHLNFVKLEEMLEQ